MIGAEESSNQRNRKRPSGNKKGDPKKKDRPSTANASSSSNTFKEENVVKKFQDLSPEEQKKRIKFAANKIRTRDYDLDHICPICLRYNKKGAGKNDKNYFYVNNNDLSSKNENCYLYHFYHFECVQGQKNFECELCQQKMNHYTNENVNCHEYFEKLYLKKYGFLKENEEVPKYEDKLKLHYYYFSNYFLTEIDKVKNECNIAFDFRIEMNRIYKEYFGIEEKYKYLLTAQECNKIYEEFEKLGENLKKLKDNAFLYYFGKHPHKHCDWNDSYNQDFLKYKIWLVNGEKTFEEIDEWIKEKGTKYRKMYNSPLEGEHFDDDKDDNDVNYHEDYKKGRSDNNYQGGPNYSSRSKEYSSKSKSNSSSNRPQSARENRREKKMKICVCNSCAGKNLCLVCHQSRSDWVPDKCHFNAHESCYGSKPHCEICGKSGSGSESKARICRQCFKAGHGKKDNSYTCYICKNKL